MYKLLHSLQTSNSANKRDREFRSSPNWTDTARVLLRSRMYSAFTWMVFFDRNGHWGVLQMSVVW